MSASAISPKLAAFPKCFMDQICLARSMPLLEWIEMGATLPVDGLELYSGFFHAGSAAERQAELRQVRAALDRHHLAMPMLCHSPDFTQPDPQLRRREIERQQAELERAAKLGAESCRVLSGQRRPEVEPEEALRWVVECLRALLPAAERLGVRLALENHYKDNFWQYPEFAQASERFCEILDRLPSPWLGVQYDPSNALLAGEDPIALLRRVRARVITMHASDRRLRPGHSVEELRTLDTGAGYASMLVHGVIGEGEIDFDAIFALLAESGFRGWVSIEDGVNGMDELRRSAEFLRGRLSRHFR